MDRYVIRGGKPGADRLEVRARTWETTTSALLDRAGVSEGARFLDLGCGAADVTLELARRAGRGGYVLAIDRDPVELEVARERARAAGLSRPEDVLRAMWASVRTGGVIVVEDADFEGSFCYPPDEGFDFWVTGYRQVLRHYGGDPVSGRKLAARFELAGIPRPELQLVQRTDFSGEAKMLPLLTVEAISQSMLDADLATEAEIDAAVTRLRAFADDDTSLCGSLCIFQAWARRLGAEAAHPNGGGVS